MPSGAHLYSGNHFLNNYHFSHCICIINSLVHSTQFCNKNATNVLPKYNTIVGSKIVLLTNATKENVSVTSCLKTWFCCHFHWLPVNSTHGQLVTRSSRHPVNSSHSQLVTTPLYTTVNSSHHFWRFLGGRPEYRIQRIQHIQRPPPVRRMLPVVGGGRAGD